MLLYSVFFINCSISLFILLFPTNTDFYFLCNVILSISMLRIVFFYIFHFVHNFSLMYCTGLYSNALHFIAFTILNHNKNARFVLRRLTSYINVHNFFFDILQIFFSLVFHYLNTIFNI